MTVDPRIPTGPLASYPVMFIPAQEQRDLLMDLLEDVELGAWDRRIVNWIAGWDASTVLTVASLLLRVREAQGRSSAEQTAT